MLYQMVDDAGAPMDAHFDVEDGALIFHSRGGTMGSSNARNTEYGQALRVLLSRISASDVRLLGVWVDSSRVQNMPLAERQILLLDEADMNPVEMFTLLSNRMAAVGRDPGATTGRGNSNKRIRFAFEGAPSGDRIALATGGVSSGRDLRSLDRLPAEELNKVTPEHIWYAIQKLRDGASMAPFGSPDRYEVVVGDGERFPPKAVFGYAASEALGFQVLPRQFTGGIGTPCFNSIENTGLTIVRIGESPTAVQPPLDPEDQIWVEGAPRLVTHLYRERAPGLGRAKKAHFLSVHGRLYCERCGLDPVEVYGPVVGDACIEAHHSATHVEDMEAGHETTLDDLQCLCANCHRVVHRELRIAARETD